jgi:hypothetical protein
MTLDLYGHLYADQLDEVGERLHEAAMAAAAKSGEIPADFLRTEAVSILNPTIAEMATPPGDRGV